MHGGHQVAQKFSMTTLPFRSVRCPGFPQTSRGKSCAVLPAIEASPCRYVGMAKSTKTSAAIPTTAQAPIFRAILINAILTQSLLIGKRSFGIQYTMPNDAHHLSVIGLTVPVAAPGCVTAIVPARNEEAVI